MGRNRQRKARLKLKAAEAVGFDENSATVPKKLEHSTDKLLNKAEENIDFSDYETAHMFCKRALELEPENLRALEMFASICIETERIEEAKACLEKAVQLCPDEGHSKYLSLGQLEVGKTALARYQKGIEVMSKVVENLQPAEATNSAKEHPLIRELSSACCSVAEMYMTDCCFEEDAENQCKLFIEKAISVDPSNPEAYQCKAGFHLVKYEINEAKETIEKCISLWLTQYEALREGRTTANEEDTPLDVNYLPSYPCRINIVKTLIELELFEDSATILEGLVEEDDEVVEVWYLLGWLSYLKGDDYKGNSRFYFQKYKEVASKVETDDEKMTAHVEELLTELGPGEDDDEEREDGEAIEEVESSGEDEEMDTTT